MNVVGNVHDDVRDRAKRELRKFKRKRGDYEITEERCNARINRLDVSWERAPREETRALHDALIRDRTGMCTLLLEMITHWRAFRSTLGDPSEVQEAKEFIFEVAPEISTDKEEHVGREKIESKQKELINQGQPEGDETHMTAIYMVVSEWSDGDLQATTAEFLARRDANIEYDRRNHTSGVQTHTLPDFTSGFESPSTPSTSKNDFALRNQLKAYNLEKYIHELKALGLETFSDLEQLLHTEKSQMRKIFSGDLRPVERAIELSNMPSREASSNSEADTGAQRQYSDPLQSRIHTDEQADAARTQVEAEVVAKMRWALEQKLSSENERDLTYNEQDPEEMSDPQKGIPGSVERIVVEDPACRRIWFVNVLETTGKVMNFWEPGLRASVGSIHPTDLSSMTRTVLLFERNSLNEPNIKQKSARIAQNEEAIRNYRATRGADDATRNAMNQRLNDLCHDTRDAQDNPMANCLWQAAQDHTYDWAFVSLCILFTLYCVSVRLRNFMYHAKKGGISIPTFQVLRQFQKTPIAVWIYREEEIFEAVEGIHQALERFYTDTHGGVKTLEAKLSSPGTSSKTSSDAISTWKHFQTIRSICDGVKPWGKVLPDFNACVFADPSNRATIWAVFRCGPEEERDRGVAEVLSGDFWVGQRITMTQDDKDPTSFSVQNLDSGEELKLLLVQCTHDIYMREGGQLMPGCHAEKV